MAYTQADIFKMSETLVEEAKKAATFAYAPYSKCQVGAALLCQDGTIVRGCNIENGSFGDTICAERTAIFKAVSEGRKDFAAIAIVGIVDGVLDGTFPPCGMCRQVMAEFCQGDFVIVLGHKDGFEIHTLDELYPVRFEL